MIRKANENDREEFIRLSEQFYHSPAVLHPVPRAYHESLFDEALRSDEYAGVYMVEDAGRAVGFGVTAKSFSREAGGKVLWLEELYILEECRGRGLGREYFSFIEKYAREHGFTRIRLEVEPDNVRARSLYERLGYRPLEYLQMVKENGGF